MGEEQLVDKDVHLDAEAIATLKKVAAELDADDIATLKKVVAEWNYQARRKADRKINWTVVTIGVSLCTTIVGWFITIFFSGHGSVK